MHRRCLLSLLLVLCAASAADAGTVTLKNGMVLEGQLVPIQGLTDRLIKQQAGEIESFPILLVDAGYKRYFVGNQQLATVDKGEKLARDDVFFLKKSVSGKDLGLASIGLPLRITPFDKFGVRTVTLRTSRGTTDVVQGVTKLAPNFLTVEGITGGWWQGLPTKAMPADQLAAMLHAAVKQQNPDDRMAVARFYLQAGLYDAAAAELAGIGRDFPEMAARVEELDRDLRQLRAINLLTELRRRRAAGAASAGDGRGRGVSHRQRVRCRSAAASRNPAGGRHQSPRASRPRPAAVGRTGGPNCRPRHPQRRGRPAASSAAAARL